MAIGYACIALGVPGARLRSCTLKNAAEEKLAQIIGDNLKALGKMLQYNIQRDIKLYRISSDVIPFGSHEVNMLPWWNMFTPELGELGQTIKVSKLRVSMHPGQYTVLNSPDESIVQAAVADLEYHARFLHSLGLDKTHKIILHIGGVYGNHKEAMERFIINFRRLSLEVQSRLVIENDEKWAINEVLQIAHSLNIPVIFDVLHHEANAPADQRKINDWIALCKETWRIKDGRQKIHYSQQQPEMRTGAHSRTIKAKEFVNFYNSLTDTKLDIMLEVKDKNLSAVKCINTVTPELPIRALEEEWARYKYVVMEHTQAGYETVSQYLRTKEDATAVGMYTIIEEALSTTPTAGSQLNAVQHVWGYFKLTATPRERKTYLKKVQGFQDGTTSLQSLKNFLHKMSENYDVDYLQNSYYFI